MRKKIFPAVMVIIFLIGCSGPEKPVSEFASVSQVETGTPVSVMLTAYSTTLIANGEDHTRLRVAIADSINREITSATGIVRIYVEGDGSLSDSKGKPINLETDEKGEKFAGFELKHGTIELLFVAGTKPDKVKVEARMEGLWAGGHEIHTIPADVVLLTPTPEQLPPTTKPIERMIGADISWLPEMEADGHRFFDNGVEKDGITLLRDRGFNYIRLRIFVNPENENGYSPSQGFCGLPHTLKMAQRVKDAGMGILLDFHYSDYWADPQKQFKPEAWEGLDFETLKDSVRTYTVRVMRALHDQGTPPDMVQVGNEINHGMIWPEGHISNLDQLAELLIAGVEGVEEVDLNVPIMMHVALGGQNKEARFWFDNMIARGVRFDIIGLSYYPRWHGTLDDLKFNLHDLAQRYNKPLNVVEYSEYKRQVHEIVFGLPNDMGKGAAIWEPLRWGELIIDYRTGETNERIKVFEELNREFILGNR